MTETIEDYDARVLAATDDEGRLVGAEVWRDDHWRISVSAPSGAMTGYTWASFGVV